MRISEVRESKNAEKETNREREREREETMG